MNRKIRTKWHESASINLFNFLQELSLSAKLNLYGALKGFQRKSNETVFARDQKDISRINIIQIKIMDK